MTRKHAGRERDYGLTDDRYGLMKKVFCGLESKLPREGPCDYWDRMWASFRPIADQINMAELSFAYEMAHPRNH